MDAPAEIEDTAAGRQLEKLHLVPVPGDRKDRERQPIGERFGAGNRHSKVDGKPGAGDQGDVGHRASELPPAGDGLHEFLLPMAHGGES